MDHANGGRNTSQPARHQTIALWLFGWWRNSPRLAYFIGFKAFGPLALIQKAGAAINNEVLQGALTVQVATLRPAIAGGEGCHQAGAENARGGPGFPLTQAQHKRFSMGLQHPLPF